MSEGAYLHVVNLQCGVDSLGVGDILLGHLLHLAVELLKLTVHLRKVGLGRVAFLHLTNTHLVSQ